GTRPHTWGIVMFKFGALALSLLAAAPAFAQAAPTAAPAAAPPQQTAAANPLDKMVCRYEDTLGTRLGRHKVCATLREWKDQQDENRQAKDRMEEGQGVPTNGGAMPPGG